MKPPSKSVVFYVNCEVKVKKSYFIVFCLCIEIVPRKIKVSDYWKIIGYTPEPPKKLKKSPLKSPLKSPIKSPENTADENNPPLDTIVIDE